MKVKTKFVLIIVAIVVIVAIVLIIFQPPFSSAPKNNLFRGAIFFILGSIFVPLGWHIWKTERPVNEVMGRLFYKGSYKTFINWFYLILFSIALGPSLIALGGMFSTRGWNALALKSQLESQKNNLIRAVIQECAINNLRLKRPPLVGTVYVTENDEIIGTKIFPVLEKNAVESFMASGLLDISKSDDSKFFEILMNYNRFIKETNYIFKIFNDDIIHIKGEDMIEKKIARTEYYQNDIRISPIVQNLFKYHHDLHVLIITKYRKFTEEQFGEETQESEQNNVSDVKENDQEE